MGIFDSLKKKAKEKVAKIGISREAKIEDLIQKRLDVRRRIDSLKTSGQFKVDKMEDLLDDYEEINEDLLYFLDDDLDSSILNKLRGVKKEMKEDRKFIREMRKFLENFEENEEDFEANQDDYIEDLQDYKEELEEELEDLKEGIVPVKESLKKTHDLMLDSFDEEEGKLRNMASAFGVSWETRKERKIRKEKEEIERLERMKKAEEEARRKAEAEAYFNRVRNNPAEYKDVLLNTSFTLFIYANNTIRGAQEYFTHTFPYLRLAFYLVKTGVYADKSGGTIHPIDSNTQFSSIKAFRGDCDIQISGKDTPAQVEKRFRDRSGLVVKFEYNDSSDKRYYIGKDDSKHNKSLAEISAELQLKGCKRADIS